MFFDFIYFFVLFVYFVGRKNSFQTASKNKFKKRKAIKPKNLIASVKSEIPNQNGGDDRIRTCGRLLILNNLANCRFQPLSHISVLFPLAEKHLQF